jgi:hypothetical protein
MITEDQRTKIEYIKNKLRIGAKIEKADYDFCKINIRLFENIRFRKVRKAMKKWQMLKS